MSTSKTIKINAWLGTLVVLGIIITINVVAHALRIRFDLTSEKQFTLSGGAAEFLARLPVPVTLKYYYTRSGEIPPVLKQYQQRTIDLLREMELASGGQVALEMYDPQPDSDEEEWAQRYGLIGQPVNPMGGDALYMGLVAVSGQREASIPFLAPNAEAQMEYNISRLIYEVSRTTKPNVGIMSSLPVMGAPSIPMRGPGQETGWIMARELRRHYDVVTVRPEAGSIAPDITTLMIIHPKDFSEQTRYAIDQFVMRGGRLIVFQDPLCLFDRNNADQMNGMRMMGGFSSQLNQLTSVWGAEMSGDDVLADIAAASPINFGNGQAERLPTWLSMNKLFMNTSDALMANLESLMFPFAGGFTLKPVEGITATPLISVSSNAVLVNSFAATMPGPEKMSGAASASAFPLAVRLHGKFTSAFPGGAPAAGADADPAITNAPHIAKCENDGVVILVGDVDFIHDQNAFRTLNILGQSLVEFANDNFSFMLSMVEQSTGSESLVGLRSRGAEDRSFSRVNKLEEIAQQRWQAEELKLMDRLQETQQRLAELQASRDDKQQMVITPEQAAEIENFRKIRFETQRELKSVRRNLREDIERLGVQIKAFNMALIPALVAGYGIFRGWRRRKG